MIGKLNEEEIEEILKDNVWGHLGCNDGFNTYVYPTNYLYDGKCILCHSQMGSKVMVMQKNARVCFQVDEVQNHKNWKSVMVLGEFQQVNDERERHYAMKAFVDRRLFIKTSESFLPGINEVNEHVELMKTARPVIYRIVIDEKSGRFEGE
jgi:nitroimidazol reductase NimA-like FMN-containing flavoprotein (pyridoxamine 5'-phosphate oxidase superfamily)